jgi:predicted 3-demethylubiquinone-9 3-methyltransferase (glyoxalase superfamily)
MFGKEAAMKTITPFLGFDDTAEEAAKFSVSIFSAAGKTGSKIKGLTRYGEEASAASGRPAGSVMTVSFALNGQEFTALNGSPQFTFTPAISFVVNCVTQKEIDTLWEMLSEGGEPGVCGWLQDKYGVSWQIVPASLGRMMQDTDSERSRRVMQALLKMRKLDIKALKQAYKG